MNWTATRTRALVLSCTALFASTTTIGWAVETAGAADRPLAPFTSSVSAVGAEVLGATWHRGCPVAPSALRFLHLSYFGFDAHAHTGTMVVNASVVSAVIDVFKTLYVKRFPLEMMVPESSFSGNDNKSMAADNTSGFNCRLAVTTGPPQWSVHAYGEAIDINPVQNPYFENGEVLPPAGHAYLDRVDLRPGMTGPGTVVNLAFASVGWKWGGRWSASPDYQHFSATGG